MKIIHLKNELNNEAPVTNSDHAENQDHYKNTDDMPRKEKETLPDAGKAAEGLLLFDGIYQHIQDGLGYSSYLRFFADGTVISVSSTGTPEEVIRWFGYDFKSRGTYTIEDDMVIFDILLPQGRISYRGRLTGTAVIEMDVHSYITDYSARRQKYYFHRFGR